VIVTRRTPAGFDSNSKPASQSTPFERAHHSQGAPSGAPGPRSSPRQSAVRAPGAPKHHEFRDPKHRHPLTGPERCLRPVGVLFNALTAQLLINGCKRWDCYPCGKRKAKQLFHRLVGCRFSRLITLTAPANTPATRDNVRRFNYAFKLLHQRLIRQWGKVDYLWANETGARTGQLHKHIAVPWRWFDYKEVRAIIAELEARCEASGKGLLGIVCDFGKPRPLTRGKPVSYCLKYLTKDKGEFPRYARRVQTNVRRKPEEKQPGWCFLPKWLQPGDMSKHRWLDQTTAEMFALAWAYLKSELALIQEDKRHEVLPDLPGQGAVA
jgi:hypothetical protein